METIFAGVFKGMLMHWKRKKVDRYITDNLKFSSDDFDKSDEE